MQVWCSHIYIYTVPRTTLKPTAGYAARAQHHTQGAAAFESCVFIWFLATAGVVQSFQIALPGSASMGETSKPRLRQLIKGHSFGEMLSWWERRSRKSVQRLFGHLWADSRRLDKIPGYFDRKTRPAI